MIDKIKELRSTEKGKTLLKFILYMIFLFFVIIICAVGGRNNPTLSSSSNSSDEAESGEIVQKELTYFDKQLLLYKGKYKFVYSVTGANVNIVYTGEYDSGNTSGYKETSEELIRYSIEDNIVYKHNLKSQEPYELLYDGVDEKLFDFKTVFSKLNSSSSQIEKKDEQKIYTYSDLDGYDYVIVTDKYNILSITVSSNVLVSSNTFKYEFKFTY